MAHSFLGQVSLGSAGHFMDGKSKWDFDFSFVITLSRYKTSYCLLTILLFSQLNNAAGKKKYLVYPSLTDSQSPKKRSCQTESQILWHLHNRRKQCECSLGDQIRTRMFDFYGKNSTQFPDVYDFEEKLV